MTLVSEADLVIQIWEQALGEYDMIVQIISVPQDNCRLYRDEALKFLFADLNRIISKTPYPLLDGIKVTLSVWPPFFKDIWNVLVLKHKGRRLLTAGL